MSAVHKKRIGVMTSGGDCAGLNAVIRAVARRAALGYDWEVVGIRHATDGLIARPCDVMELTDFAHDDALLRQGGTLLGTLNKGGRLKTQQVIEGYRSLGLDALIGIGGDGSLAILRKIAQAGGINLVGIPKTIDNDLGLTEYSVGFTTAMNVAVEALDRLQPTAESHERLMVLEVMGRDAGHIALFAGVAGGADAILIPEMTYNLDDLAQHCLKIRASGRNHALIVVAEAVKTNDGDAILASERGQKKRYGGIGHWLGHELTEKLGWESRVTVLGHLQRGGTPSARDRIIASAFGVRAVDLVAAGKFDRMVAWSQRQVIDVPLKKAVQGAAPVDTNGTMIQTAQGLGIYVGNSGRLMTIEIDFPPSGVWEGVLALYKRPGVSDMCLHWQERVDLDVAFTLVLAHYALVGLRVTNLDQLQQWADGWREGAVVPLRKTRQYLKWHSLSQAGDIRHYVKQLELLAERAQIQQLEAMAELEADRPTATLTQFLRDQGLGTQDIAVLHGLMGIKGR